MRRFVRDQGLAIAMFAIFATTLLGLVVVAWDAFNHEQALHGESAVGILAYVTSPAFAEAVFENWESEFLQMGAYVLLTALLVSRGSAESKDPDRIPQDADPRNVRRRRSTPWPVRRGGFVLLLYEHSLTIALFAIFLASFVLHAASGAASYSAELVDHGEPPVSTFAYLATSQFWFESLQNWQSEFLAVGSLVVLSIFLRQRGSPESKPVAASHGETGE